MMFARVLIKNIIRFVVPKQTLTRNDRIKKGLPLQVRLLLESKYGSNWKQRIIGKRIKMPFIPHKFGIEYEKILLKYFKIHFINRINEVTQELINEVKFRQDDIRADMIEQKFYDAFDDIEADASHAEIGLKILINTKGNKVYEFQKEKYSFAVKRVFGIAIQLNDENVLNNLPKWTETNLNLIKNVRQEIIPKLKSQVASAFQNGIRAEELKDQIKKITGYTEYRAKLIARDQIGKLYGQMNKKRGLDLGLEYYIWRGCMDERERLKHKKLEGEKRNWNEGIIPGEEIRCRCCGDSVIDASLLE